MNRTSLPRRRFLAAAGAFVGLPFLESQGIFAAAKEEAPALPRRLAYLYVPNGVNVASWSTPGANGELPLTLQSLARLRREVTVISGLNHENATPGQDGGGDHSRATAVYLTGVRPKKTGGSDIRNGVSIDQLLARQIGRATRLPSLELSTDGPRTSGVCDSGYSCAYQFNLSWASPTRPAPAEQNPRVVFERLFGSGGPDAAERRHQQRSVLDFIRDDARSLARELDRADREKMDQYLTSVREVEQRIERTEKSPALPPDVKPPAGIPESYQAHIRTMFELLALAFQADATRICTFTLANDGSNRAFPEIGVPEAHHQLSHHRNNPATLDKIARIDRFYVEQFAWFLERLQAMREGERTLLDQSLLVYGGCLSDANKHLHSNLPIVVAGHGGGSLNPGRLLAAPDPTPMCNLHLALAQRMGVRLAEFGDSTGALSGL